jgi:pyrroline-5-carboxylate reductase
MRIGVIGTGTIASAVVRGLAGCSHDITVSERSQVQSSQLAAEFDTVSIADNQRVLDLCDVVFLGLMAEQAGMILSALQFQPHHRVISLMAGAELGQVADMVVPARAEAVMIPFPAIAVGGSPIMVRGRAELVQSLFGETNIVFDLASDAEMAAFLCAQAVLSPAVKMLSDTSDWLGARISDPVQAERFLRQLVGSSLLGSSLGPLLQALNTPGGYNARLRDHMVDHGMSRDLSAGLDRLLNGS